MRLTLLVIAMGFPALLVSSCAETARPGDDSPAPMTTPRPQDGPLGTNTGEPTPTTLPTYRSE